MWVKEEVADIRSCDSSHMHHWMNPDDLTQHNAIVVSGLQFCLVKHFFKGPCWQPWDCKLFLNSTDVSKDIIEMFSIH